MVAVDALPVFLIGVDHVAIDETLVEVLETALVDGQILVGHVGRRDEAVGDVGIYTVFGDGDVKRFLALPRVLAFDEHLHRDVAFCCQGGGFHVLAAPPRGGCRIARRERRPLPYGCLLVS